MSVSEAQKIARHAIAVELIESPGWQELVLKAAVATTSMAYKNLAFGTLTFEDAQRCRGIIKAMRDLIDPVYQDAERPIPEMLRPYFDPS